MVDTPDGDSQPSSGGSIPGRGVHELEVDLGLSSFLPEGVELAVSGDGGDEATAQPADVMGSPGRDVLDAGALDRLEHDLDAVDAAIERLDAGTYGIDPNTGQRIDDARLAEDPTRLTAGP